MVLPNATFSELVIFTTNRPSDVGLYTLADNPAYRNSMTLKGYLHSGNPGYVPGHGMATPP